MGRASVVLPNEIEALPLQILTSTGISPAELAVSSKEELLSLQRQLLMGSTWGLWEVSPNLMAIRPMQKAQHTYRLEKALPAGVDPQSPWADRIWTELLRIAIAYRLWPGEQGSRIAYSTIHKYLHLLGMLARRIAPHQGEEFWSKLSVEDLKACLGRAFARALPCLVFMHARGVISDVPISRARRAREKPRRSRIDEAENVEAVSGSVPYLPFPDDFLGKGGHRAIWFLENIGPSLLSFLEAAHELPVREYNDDPRSSGYGEPLSDGQRHAVATARKNELVREWDWLDAAGKPLREIPFPCTLSAAPKGEFTWPPDEWSRALSMCGLLQACHLWVIALAMGGRHGEILSLEVGFVGRLESPTPTATFRTSKMDIVGGRSKEAPIPSIVIAVASQQERLSELLKRMYGVEEAHLWVSTWTRAGRPLVKCGAYLSLLAESFCLVSLLEGTNAHMHRFRKSLVRACALCLVHAPKVLMDVLGHRDEQVTVMRYILSDPGLLAEVQETVKELVILKGLEVVKRVDEIEGGAAPRIRERVREYAKRQGKSALEPQNMMEFVRALTEDGGGWAIIAPGIVCTGFTRGGLCNKGQGSANPDYCHPKCDKQVVMPDYEESGFAVSSAIVNAISTIDYMLNKVFEAEQAGESMIVAQFVGQIKAMLGRWKAVDEHFKSNTLLRKHIPSILLETKSV